MTANPFASSASIPSQRGVFGTARLVQPGFLFRVIDFEWPGTGIQSRLVYDAWWFRQKIAIDGHLAWFRISWLKIQRQVEFRIPTALESEAGDGVGDGEIEIDFGRGLMIRRFRLWLGGILVYDEIN